MLTKPRKTAPIARAKKMPAWVTIAGKPAPIYIKTANITHLTVGDPCYLHVAGGAKIQISLDEYQAFLNLMQDTEELSEWSDLNK